MHSWVYKNLVSRPVEEGQSWLLEQLIYAIIGHQAPKVSTLGLSSVASILKFLILFKQGALHFHLGIASYAVCPGRDHAQEKMLTFKISFLCIKADASHRVGAKVSIRTEILVPVLEGLMISLCSIEYINAKIHETEIMTI